MSNEELLKKNGWMIECESPFEIRNEETESFASNEGARNVVDYLKYFEIIYKLRKSKNKLENGKINETKFISKTLKLLQDE